MGHADQFINRLLTRPRPPRFGSMGPSAATHSNLHNQSQDPRSFTTSMGTSDQHLSTHIPKQIKTPYPIQDYSALPKTQNIETPPVKGTQKHVAPPPIFLVHFVKPQELQAHHAHRCDTRSRHSTALRHETGRDRRLPGESPCHVPNRAGDRKSTRLNSSHT